jgi:uncharacterized membrane protein YhaH (DUF805 family)
MTSQQPLYAAKGPVPPLDMPYYGAPPVEAFVRVFKKYAVFTGRASRSEFWWWALASAIISAILDSIGQNVVNGQPTGTSPLGVAWGLATLVPGLAVAARRLHDVNLSAWLLLLAVIPLLGWIALIVMLAQRENPLGARFDRRPAQQYGAPGYYPPPYPPAAPPPAPGPPTAPPPASGPQA